MRYDSQIGSLKVKDCDNRKTFTVGCDNIIADSIQDITFTATYKIGAHERFFQIFKAERLDFLKFLELN